MSDYRNPNDPMRRDLGYETETQSTNAAWGWVAGAVFVVILLALAFGVGHTPDGTNQVANNSPPPAASRPSPSGPASPNFTPSPNPLPPRPVDPAPQQ